MSATTSHSDHSLRCVWMDAGMLSFKLCDRYFDCDRCPVDAIFRGDRPLSPPPAASPPLSVLVDLPGDLDPAWIPLLRPLAECHLDRDLAYSTRHLWARELGDRQVMVGLDDCLLRLLPEETSIVLRALDSTVDKGEPLGWAYAGPSALPLPAPASGRLVRRNTTDPAPLSFFRETHPSPWLVMLDEAEPDSLCDVEEAARATASDLTSLTVALSAALREMSADPGPCLNDGGTPVASCAEALGLPRYMDILTRILGPVS